MSHSAKTPPTQDDWEGVRRAVAAWGGSAAGPSAGGEAEILAALVSLHALREQLAGWEPQLIEAARERGVSWQRLAAVLGVASRQAAERRFLRLAPSATGEPTGEARVQATRDRRAAERALEAWAKQHAGELRRLAAEVISLSGVARPGRRHQLELAERLAADDPALLLGPLAATRPHLTSSHPAIADHLGDVVERIDRVERASRRP